MDPSRRDPARSAGKIPINFLLAEDDSGTNPQQSSHSQQRGAIQYRRDRSSQGSSGYYSPNIAYPTIAGSSSLSQRLQHNPSSSPSSPSSSSSSYPPLRVDRTYSTESSSSAGNSQIAVSPSTERGAWHATPAPPDGSSILGDRKPRAPRPSYSEEQKFFIMYSRIIRDNTWPEIEDRFERLFGTRSKGGLTSVYYRVRREWGLMEVLKSGPGSYAADCREVEQRAMNFSRDFLRQIGYLPQGT